MELKEFVSQTITEIVEGIAAAQKNILPMGATLAMHAKHKIESLPEGYALPDNNLGSVHFVKFDIAVSVSENKSSKGTFGIVVAQFGVGVSGKDDSSSAQQNRIGFVVPIRLDRKLFFPEQNPEQTQ